MGWIGWRMDGEDEQRIQLRCLVCMYGICVWVYTSPFVFFWFGLVWVIQEILYLNSKPCSTYLVVVYTAPASRVIYIS
ncbi:hypothetical protein V8C43DRAFT_28458 [Trichoderma afarasin]